MRPLAAACLLAVLSISAQAQEPHPALAALAPLVGEPWQGTFENQGQTVTDLSRWEWAMNKQALRNIHALEGGAYGGETLIWAEADSLRFLYVTSGGFTTSGTGHVAEDGALVVDEVVSGHPEIDRARSTSRVNAEGHLETFTQMRRLGVWEDSRRVTYVRTPGATLPPGFAPECSGG
ncbi:MAG: hypothetical protein AAF791_00770 [Bacteroidota bacterium]